MGIYLLINNAQHGHHPNAPLYHGHYLRMGRVSQAEPRIVRAGDEDVDHRTIASVQRILQRPIVVTVADAVEAGRDKEQHRKGRPVDDGRKRLGGRVAAPVKVEGGIHRRQYPGTVRDYVGNVFNLRNGTDKRSY